MRGEELHESWGECAGIVDPQHRRMSVGDVCPKCGALGLTKAVRPIYDEDMQRIDAVECRACDDFIAYEAWC